MADYVTTDEFLKRYDARDVGDLVSDTSVQVSPTGLLSDANLSAAIGDASGDIDMSLLVGGKYQTSDLESLTGNALNTLRRIASDLTMFYLLARRPDFNPDRLEAYDKVRARHLNRLKSGEDVFNLDSHVNAGRVDVAGPSTQNYNDLNLFRDRVNNYFPRRELPNNR